MNIHTTRFGDLNVGADDMIRFPAGLLGLDGCVDWAFLVDAHNEALGWLQSADRADVALAVVSPRQFVPDYQVRVPRREISPLGLDAVESAHVLAIVSTNESSITLNLKAPLIVNARHRVGMQVVNAADEPLQYEVFRHPQLWKKTA
jgi:flagellar assembly factor FliW